jgi:hypothetical protein
MTLKEKLKYLEELVLKKAEVVREIEEMVDAHREVLALVETPPPPPLRYDKDGGGRAPMRLRRERSAQESVRDW